MNNDMKRVLISWIFIAFLILIPFKMHAAGEIYLLKMTNDHEIQLAGYRVDLFEKRVHCVSVSTHLMFTLPLEFVREITTNKPDSGIKPDIPGPEQIAQPAQVVLLYRNNNTYREKMDVDDGGVYVGFARASSSSDNSDLIWVDSYMRGGSKVSGHWKTKPDSTRKNNLSHPGSTRVAPAPPLGAKK